MKVLITGGTGLIGSAVARALRSRGDEVVVASRSGGGDGVVSWDPTRPGSLRLPEGTDAVVHLAGAPLFGRRWSKTYKREIRNSRVQGTKTVIRALEDYTGSLGAFVSGSAVGYYGDRGEEKLVEEDPAADDFLGSVCRQWEQVALDYGRESPTPVSVIRTGIVLSTRGGALPRMLNPFWFVKPFHWGLGGPIGRGEQYMPWIHVKDEVGLILHLLDQRLEGPFNLTAPHPVRNRIFTRALGEVLNRPTPFPVPKFALRIMFGEAARTIYASARVLPERALEAGYSFHFSDILPALEDLIES